MVKKALTKSKGKKPRNEPSALYPSRPKNFRIGNDIQPKKDLGRYVKWPRYVRLQRQKKILYQRLKVPPSINQFTRALDKNHATELFKLLEKYKPETKAEKKVRLQKAAEEEVKTGKEKTAKKKNLAVVKFGLKHVTNLIEEKKAKLVVIANNVDPIELVVWLPALCRKMEVPYCIVKEKAKLGTFVHQKTATCLALTTVLPEDEKKLHSIADMCKTEYNDNVAAMKRWGGGIMGLKTQAKVERMEKALEEERQKKAAMMM